jgi:hypothetical protein
LPTRGLTIGERAILKFVFGDTLIQNTLITTNDANRGGEGNSITYTDIPHYSKKIWCPDFSAVTAETWTFVHKSAEPNNGCSNCLRLRTCIISSSQQLSSYDRCEVSKRRLKRAASCSLFLLAEVVHSMFI